LLRLIVLPEPLQASIAHLHGLQSGLLGRVAEVGSFAALGEEGEQGRLAGARQPDDFKFHGRYIVSGEATVGAPCARTLDFAPSLALANQPQAFTSSSMGTWRGTLFSTNFAARMPTS